jgi:hypothetical protein
VEIPAGTFLLRRSVRLRRGVTLRGSGTATVLRRVAQVRASLTQRNAPGASTLSVADSRGFELHNVTGMTVSANRCLDDGKEPAQSLGIEETGSSDANLVSGNHCRGNAAGGIRLLGKQSVASGNLE